MLSVPGPAEEVPDAHLLLRAYEKWGAACVEHLLGAFAFAVWDPDQKQLLCAQDHFGVRPLYYYYRPGKLFAFASEIKALFALPDVSPRLDEVRIAEHLMAPVEPDVRRTFFENVRRMAPAHALVVTPDTLRSHEYWSLTPDREIQLPSDEAYADRFRALFREAVRVRLRSEGPVGCALSGGLDSSAVTCQATQLRSPDEPPLHTYSAVFDEVEASDESEYIDAVLEAHATLKSYRFSGDQKSPLAEWDELYDYVDGACKAGNVYISWRLYRQAQADGVRVLLDGFDGDIAVSHGIGKFNQLREEGRWIRLIQEVAAFADKIGESPRGAVWSWIKGPLLSTPGLSHLVALRRTIKDRFAGERETRDPQNEEPIWRRAMHRDLARSVEPNLEANECPKPPTERENHYQLLTRPVMARTLDLRNYVAARSSMEVRFPFFDKRLVEFCLALPPSQKLRRGWSRWILRQAMENILPSAIQWREGKANLGVALDRSLRTYERARFERLMQGEIGGINRFVEIDFLRDAVPKYLDEKIGGSSTEGLIVWRALALALWLDQMEDRAGVGRGSAQNTG
jgi:asparagine synthase (glutamine-hydrolysing)